MFMPSFDNEFARPGDEELSPTYEAWFCAKVMRAMSDNGPTIPHEQVMAEMKKIISAAQRRRD
jgi:predicted nucleic acid-binding Zn ribbon protein